MLRPTKPHSFHFVFSVFVGVARCASCTMKKVPTVNDQGDQSFYVPVLLLNTICVSVSSDRSASVTVTRQESSCPLRTVAQSRLPSSPLTGDSPVRLLVCLQQPRWPSLYLGLRAPSAPRAMTVSPKNSITSSPSSALRARLPNACRMAV